MKKTILKIGLTLMLVSLIALPQAAIGQQQSPNAVQKAAKQTVDQTKKSATRQAQKLKKEAEQTINRSKALLQDLTLTLTSLVSYENPFEDFADLFRNQCQVDDIEKVQQTMEKVQRDLRGFALAGKQQDFNLFKKEMINLAVELMFVRKMIDTKDGNYVIKPEAQILSDLSGVATGGVISEEELKALVSQLIVKYEPALKNYKDCSIFNDWKKVQKRVEKLAKALESAGKDLGETIEEPFERLAKKPGDSDKAKKDAVKRSAKDVVGKYLGEHVSVNLPQPAVKQFGDTITQTAKTIQGIVSSDQSVNQGKSIEQLQKEISDNQYIFLVETEVAEMKAKYEILYGEAGDNAINDLLKRMDGLNKTIEDSTKKTLPPVIKCLSTPNEKQCTKIK